MKSAPPHRSAQCAYSGVKPPEHWEIYLLLRGATSSFKAFACSLRLVRFYRLGIKLLHGENTHGQLRKPTVFRTEQHRFSRLFPALIRPVTKPPKTRSRKGRDRAEGHLV